MVFVAFVRGLWQGARQDVWIRAFENVVRVILNTAEESLEAAGLTRGRGRKNLVMGVDALEMTILV